MNRDSKDLRFFLLLLVIVIPLFSLGQSNHGLWTPDEPRVAEIGREMALSGKWAVPTLNQRPFLEHPPLYYATVALAFKAFGVSDGVARLPSAVFAFGGVLVLFFLGAMMYGPRIGFLSAFILATVGEYFRVAHWAIVDSALTLFILLALTFFWVAYCGQNRSKKTLFYSLCYVFCTLAFYTKGFIGIALPGLAVLVFLGFEKNLREVLRMHVWLGILIFFAMTLPWFLSLWPWGGKEFLEVFLLHNHLERFAGGSTGHTQPFYYYLTRFPAGFLPWSPLVVPVAAWLLGRNRQTEDRSSKGLLFATCWFISGFVLLSVASTKRILYLMPIFAPASLLTGCYIDSTLNRSTFRWFERFFARFFGLIPVFVGLAAIPLYTFSLRKFDLVATRSVTAWLVLFAAATTTLSILGLWNYKRDKGRFWKLSGGSVFSMLLLGLLAVIPLLDQQKSFAPFCKELARVVPPSSKLYSYQPDETIRGAVPFYTGRFLSEIETLSSLEAAIAQEKKVFLVIRDKKDRLKKEISSTGQLSLLSGQSTGLHSSLALYVVTAPSLSGEKGWGLSYEQH